jgi:hypothetical protein
MQSLGVFIPPECNNAIVTATSMQPKAKLELLTSACLSCPARFGGTDAPAILLGPLFDGVQLFDGAVRPVSTKNVTLLALSKAEKKQMS